VKLTWRRARVGILNTSMQSGTLFQTVLDNSLEIVPTFIAILMRANHDHTAYLVPETWLLSQRGDT